MNQILLSFLCGAAFLGGATVVLVFIAFLLSMKKPKVDPELIVLWQERNALQREQNKAILLVASSIQLRKP